MFQLLSLPDAEETEKFIAEKAAKAKEQQIESGGAVPQKSAKPPIDTRQEIAQAAGVSHDTIAKVERIERQAEYHGNQYDFGLND